MSEHSEHSNAGDHNEHSEQASSSGGLFLDNQKYHTLTASQRITLAHKYIDIPPKVESNTRQKDKNVIVDEDRERLISSFPISTLITDAYANYVHSFEKESFKNLAGSKPGSANSSEQSAIPASNRFDIKSGFQISPHIEKWEFKTHYRDVPQSVQFDGNIADIKASSSDPLPSSIKLSDQEWGNLQKAASFSLRAISHADWFQKSSVSALDDALSLLNPEIENENRCIELLQDVKQMQIGLQFAFEKLAKLNVYQQSGVTSILRKEFLQNAGSTIPVEQKCQLFGSPYGNSFVFQGLIHQVTAKVQEFRSASVVNKSLDTALKLADSMAKTGASSGSSRSQNPAPYSPRKTRGGGNSRSKKQPQYPNQNYHAHFTRQNQFYQPYNNNYQQHKNRPFHQQGSGRGGNGPRNQGPKPKGGPNRGKGKKGN